MIADLLSLLGLDSVSAYQSALFADLLERFPDTEITALSDLGLVAVPWDYIAVVVVLCLFVVCIFKMLRSLICKML